MCNMPIHYSFLTASYKDYKDIEKKIHLFKATIRNNYYRLRMISSVHKLSDKTQKEAYRIFSL